MQVDPREVLPLHDELAIIPLHHMYSHVLTELPEIRHDMRTELHPHGRNGDFQDVQDDARRLAGRRRPELEAYTERTREMVNRLRAETPEWATLMDDDIRALEEIVETMPAS